MKLSDLENECAVRGLAVTGTGKNGKILRMDYTKALVNWSLDNLRSQGQLLPGCEWVNTQLESPQLADSQGVFAKEQQFKDFIGRSDVTAEEKFDGCFGYNAPVLLSDGTTMPIGKIVEEKLDVEVLSFNHEKNCVEPRKVVNWYNNGKKDTSEWLHLSVPRGTSYLSGFGRRVGYGGGGVHVTKNHKYYDGSGYSGIESLDAAFVLVREPNVFQEQVIIGSLLGDGSLCADTRKPTVSTRMHITHSIKQQDYLEHKVKSLGCFSAKVEEGVSGYGSSVLGFRTSAFPFLSKIYEDEYIDGKKVFSKKFSDKLQPLALAIWYMDDGHLSGGGLDEAYADGKTVMGRSFGTSSTLHFATHNFDLNTVQILADWFMSRGIHCDIVHDDRWEDKNKYNSLCVSGDSADYFFQIIAPYVVPSLSYKLPLRYRCLAGAVKWWDFSEESLQLKKIPIKKASYVSVGKGWRNPKKWRIAYDIEVEGNHNYFVDGFLVHNCRIIITYYPGVGFELFSRNRSVVDFLFGNYTDHVYGWQREVTKDIFPYSFAIDGEIISLNPSVGGHVVTDTMLAAVVAMLGMNQVDSHRMQAEAGYPLRFKAFDCIMYDGVSMMNDTLLVRRQMLDITLNGLSQTAHDKSLPQLNWIEPVKVVRGSYEDKLAFYNEVTSRGGEGLILKTDGAIYKPVEARGGQGGGFIKWKRSSTQTLGDTIDAFVDGRFTKGEGKNEGLVGSIGFSVYLLPSGQVHPIAMVSGISDELRKTLTVSGVGGEVSLNPEWVGRVAEIEGQDISSRSKALSHARLKRWREGADSKSPEQCTLQEALLNDMVL